MAIELTGDPEGLARALEKIEWQEKPILRWFLGLKKETSSFWHSHPPLHERVRRIREFNSGADYGRLGSSEEFFPEPKAGITG